MPPATEDRAAAAQPGDRLKPVRVIAVSSGKGGVGKTNVSVNLSAALSRSGQSVMLMDADLGLANVDVLLGLQPRLNLSHVLAGECGLEEVIIDGPGGIAIVPAASGIARMADLEPAQHVGIIHAFSELTRSVDVLVVDTAAGLHDSVTSFCRAAQEVLVVVCDEPASITDAYALIKVLYRDHGIQRFRILANMVRNEQEDEGRGLFRKLVAVCERFLDDVMLDYLGSIPHDDYLRKAVQRRRSVVDAFPSSPSARAFASLGRRIQQWPMPRGARGGIEFFVERLVASGQGDPEPVP
ncbi:MinD/ParA family protein [Ectothiorhodospira mobilis]|uniref:MinD/ParA family protein n=1 Tax=Ectothiorhodospira mobilis TaxID=195064 RepID=UPI0019032C48|nr:MinD/ParA family protein [Ectothiorhodospira mobilis]MBK1690705.1 cobyrinic acid a,c-diamide synthase [Ectothiorhodospira mobilis]